MRAKEKMDYRQQMRKRLRLCDCDGACEVRKCVCFFFNYLKIENIVADQRRWCRRRRKQTKCVVIETKLEVLISCVSARGVGWKYRRKNYINLKLR